MKAPSTSKAAAAALTTYYYSYVLGRSLYIPLTSRANSRTLPETRGPGFTLPSDVVNALLRVREAEGCAKEEKHNVAVSSGDNVRSLASLPLPPHPLPKVYSLSQRPLQEKKSHTNHETSESGNKPRIEFVDNDGLSPSIIDLVNEVTTRLHDDLAGEDEPLHDSIVIAGEGEPTLRLSALLSIAHRATSSSSSSSTFFSKSKHDSIPIRVVTNGLAHAIPNNDNNNEGMISSAIPAKMKEAGITSVSVALMTANPEQYDEFMQPMIHPDYVININSCRHDGMMKTTSLSSSGTAGLAHGIVCQFITESLKMGLDVEVTGVDRPDVDKVHAETLAMSLGVTNPFRWRPYFPSKS